MPRHSLVLVPTERADIEALIAWFTRAFGKCDSAYICGIHSYPHITITQTEVDESQLGKLQTILANFVGVPVMVDLKNIYLDQKKDAIWTGCSIHFNTELQQLHEDAIQKLKDKGFGARNGSGAMYWPHLTSARIHTMKDVDIDPLMKTEFMDRPISCVVEQGPSGPNWQYLKAL